MLVLIAAAVVMLLVSCLGRVVRDSLSVLMPSLALAGLLAALLAAYWGIGRAMPGPFNLLSPDGSLLLTRTGLWVMYLGLFVGALLVLATWNPNRSYQRSGGGDLAVQIGPEFFALLLISLAGLMLLAAGRNLIVLFLAVELVSLPTYVMVTLSRPQAQAREAGLKYFFLGALSAALLAYGFSFLYGLTGSVHLDIIAASPQLRQNALGVLALVLVLAGLGFKIAAFPMHLYVADVYQGAAAPVSALLAFLPKFAGFYGLYLVMSTAGSALLTAAVPMAKVLAALIGILAAATMTIGNLLALRQRNLKRLLAYSSIAHSGYILLAFMALPSGSIQTVQAILFYVFAYGVATLGAFAILSLMERQRDEAQEIADLTGLARRRPGLAAGLAICIFSLIGMPLTAGFVGKFYVFSTLLRSQLLDQAWIVTLLTIALINAAVAVGYYLRIISACYLDSGAAPVRIQSPLAPVLGIVLAAVLTILLGIAPQLLLKHLDTLAARSDNVQTIQVRQEDLTTIYRADPGEQVTRSDTASGHTGDLSNRAAGTDPSFVSQIPTSSLLLTEQ